MATTFFTTYRAPVNSFPTGQRDIGMHKAGRYSGFDLLSSGGGLNLILSHTNAVQKTTTNNVETAAFGSILFKSGVVAHVDDSINLTIETNSGNSMERNDIIIAENIYQEVSGGTPITFSVVKGPTNSSALPDVPNPNTQIVIGVLTIEANGFQYSHISYEPSYPGLPGDMTYEVLAHIINASAQVPPATTTVAGTTRYATGPEARARVIGNAAITPASLSNYQATTGFMGLVQRASTANITGSTGDRNNAELYITPALLELFKANFETEIQALIDNSLPGQATTTVPGIMRIASPQELAARSSLSVALAPGHIPNLGATATETGLVTRAGQSVMAMVPSLHPPTGTIGLADLNHIGLGTTRVIKGMVQIHNPNGLGSGIENDWSWNVGSLTLPQGWTTSDIKIVSLQDRARKVDVNSTEVSGTLQRNFTRYRIVGSDKVEIMSGTRSSIYQPFIGIGENVVYYEILLMKT